MFEFLYCENEFVSEKKCERKVLVSGMGGGYCFYSLYDIWDGYKSIISGPMFLIFDYLTGIEIVLRYQYTL